MSWRTGGLFAAGILVGAVVGGWAMIQARNQAVILGCTELVMLVDPGTSAVPVYDTTALHSQAAVDWMLGGRLPAAPRLRVSQANSG